MTQRRRGLIFEDARHSARNSFYNRIGGEYRLCLGAAACGQPIFALSAARDFRPGVARRGVALG
jgi:hypothetical protein